MDILSRKLKIYIAFFAGPFVLSAFSGWYLASLQPLSVMVLYTLVLYTPSIVILYYPIYRSGTNIPAYIEPNDSSDISKQWDSNGVAQEGAAVFIWFGIVIAADLIYLFRGSWLVVWILIWAVSPIVVFIDLSLNVNDPDYIWVFVCMIPILNILGLLAYIHQRDNQLDEI
jgi:hypothetical protein